MLAFILSALLQPFSTAFPPWLPAARSPLSPLLNNLMIQWNIYELKGELLCEAGVKQVDGFLLSFIYFGELFGGSNR